MTTRACLRGRYALMLTLLLAWLLAAGVLNAQPGTGTIHGRIFNPATKEYVNNTEVRPEGTTRATIQVMEAFTVSNAREGKSTAIAAQRKDS